MPVCPRCTCEYREGFKICADCGVELLDIKCEEHPDIEATSLCLICKKPLCDQCMVKISGGALCSKHCDYQCKGNMVVVYTTGQEPDAHLLQGILEDKEIPCVVDSKRDLISWLTAEFDVMVPCDYVLETQVLLKGTRGLLERRESLDIPERESLDISEVEELRWIIDLPRPRQVKKEPLLHYVIRYVVAVILGGGLASLLALAVLMKLGVLADDDPDHVKIGIAILFAIAVGTYLVHLDKSDKLMANGNVTFGKIVGAEWEGGVEGELGWRLDYKFRDNNGTVHAAAYKYADEKEWQGQVGDILPVFYEQYKPSRNLLLLDLTR